MDIIATLKPIMQFLAASWLIISVLLALAVIIYILYQDKKDNTSLRSPERKTAKTKGNRKNPTKNIKHFFKIVNTKILDFRKSAENLV